MSGMVVQLTTDQLEQLVRKAVRDELGARATEAVFMTRAEVAELMQCSEKTVLARIKAGLPAAKLGTEWRFERSEVLEFMRTRKAG